MQIRLSGTINFILFLSLLGCVSPDSRQAVGSEHSSGALETGAVSNAAVQSSPGTELVRNSDPAIISLYSDVSFEKCEKIDETKVGGVPYSITAKCSGVAGYSLELLEVDARQSVNILFPSGKKHELNFQKVVSPAFSSTGDTAEWRVVTEKGRQRPIAMIIRLLVDKSVEDPDKGTDVSYLTVSKITDSSACVTDVVDPGPDQNVKARQLADTSATRPCRGEYPWLPKGDS